MIKPLGDKILVEIIENNKKKLGDKVIEIVGNNKPETKIIVKELGCDVKEDIPIGAELITFISAAILVNAKFKGFGLVPESDVWGYVK